MPKGSKKRKAAKKKKENEVNIQSPTGSEDPKSHEDKEIDEDASSYTVTSPTASTSTTTSQEQHNQLGQENEEDLREGSSVESAVSVNNNKPIERSEEEVVQNIRDLKPQEEEEKNIVVIEGNSASGLITIDYAESAKESNFLGSSSESGNSSGSSSGSSSDEESRSIEKKEDNCKSVEKREEKYCNSVTDSSQQVDLIDVVTLPVEVTQNVEVTSAEKAVDSGLTDLPPKKMLPVIDVSIIESGGGDETKTSVISDNQVVPVPPTVQPTSWKSCCGLFDVFMGSNR